MFRVVWCTSVVFVWYIAVCFGWCSVILCFVWCGDY